MLRLRLLLCFCVWLTAFEATEEQVVRPVASTSFGKVQGVVTNVKGTDRNVHTYRGVPYAMSPTGERRISPPQDPEPWAGVRDASIFPPVCTQAPAGFAFLIAPNSETSEDCLFLNIHVPEPAEGSKNTKKPVMAWFNGDSLKFGGAPIYDGSALAAIGDVVVVAINYRLGILGFLSFDDEEAPVNLGLQDKIHALKWVKREISNFGGDPDSITILGESA